MSQIRADIEWKRWILQNKLEPELAAELLEIKDNREERYDRFYQDLKFGTGGLRGKVGVGINRINIYTIKRATQGFAEYLKKMGGEKAVVIAYDSRQKSFLFAQVTAEVLVYNGIRVFIFERIMPTPALSYGIRFLKCDGGIVITASHNPAEYNGYKIYGNDGGQITDLATSEIQKEINCLDLFKIKYDKKFETLIKSGHVSFVPEDAIEKYICSVSGEVFLSPHIRKTIKVVYTPLHGTGLESVLSVLNHNGYKDVTIVEEQRNTDGSFKSCRYPNPENTEAFILAIEYANKLNADIALATDPDCDRIGIAVKGESGFDRLTGNEIGLLLFDYICENRKKTGRMPEKPIMMKTIVTTGLSDRIAELNGVQTIEVLTGFKYIGEELNRLERIGQVDNFIFGMEESHGYLTGSYVRDKDGVNGALMLCDMCESYKREGYSIKEALNKLYDKYGYCLDSSRKYIYNGQNGQSKMEEIMNYFGSGGVKFFNNRENLMIENFSASERKFADGKTEKLLLPKANVIKIWLDNKSFIALRPSGTEAKLKIYLSIQEKIEGKAKIAEANIYRKIDECIKSKFC